MSRSLNDDQMEQVVSRVCTRGGGYLVLISALVLTASLEMFRGCLQSLQTNAGIVL